MQPNYPNNPYSNAGVPNYGGQPYPYPQPMPPQMAQQAVPVSPNIQAATPVAPSAPQASPSAAVPPAPTHRKTTLADGTVLPDVIYVKKKGTLFALIAVTILLIGCAGYAIYSTLQHNSASSKVDELTAKTTDLEKRLETVRSALGFTTNDELTTENISALIVKPEGALDIDLTSFDSGSGVNIRSIRITSSLRYALTDISYYGVSTYYYRDIQNGGWNYALSHNSTVDCREVSAEAMKVIIELGGIDKYTNDDGKQYDCIDVQNGDKLYDFADALNDGVYKK